MKRLLLMITLFPLLCSAEIYKWTDEFGQIHYGDAPKNKRNAEKIVVNIKSYQRPSIEDANTLDKTNSKQVTMYATSWCGYCRKARNYFQQNKIQYTEYDIEKDLLAKSKYDQLGVRGVPVILVGKKRMNGFSVAGFERIYNSL